MVHGWSPPLKVRGLRLALLIFLEIIDKTTNGSTCSFGLLVDIFELAGRYIFFIHGDVKLALDSRARPLRISQETDELPFVSESKPSAILCIDDPAASCIYFCSP